MLIHSMVDDQSMDGPDTSWTWMAQILHGHEWPRYFMDMDGPDMSLTWMAQILHGHGWPRYIIDMDGPDTSWTWMAQILHGHGWPRYFMDRCLPSSPSAPNGPTWSPQCVTCPLSLSIDHLRFPSLRSVVCLCLDHNPQFSPTTCPQSPLSLCCCHRVPGVDLGQTL